MQDFELVRRLQPVFISEPFVDTLSHIFTRSDYVPRMAATREPVRIVMLREGKVARRIRTKRTQIDQIAHRPLDD